MSHELKKKNQFIKVEQILNTFVMLEMIVMSKMFPALFSKYRLLSHEGKVISYKYLSITIEAMLVYYIREKNSALNIKSLKDSNKKSLKR